MTEDELMAALRASVGQRDVAPPATHEAVTEAEEACGYSLPPLLARLLTQVANGGFGPRGGVAGVRGHEWRSTDFFEDMTEWAKAAADDPEWGQRRWCLPLVQWGCAIATMIDCRDPAGPLWGWDPNLCCLDHALFPLDQCLAQMLEESLDADYPEPFYAGYFADLRNTGGCEPLVWENGRIAAGRD